MTSTVALFLAHAIALEVEAAERYEELADVMEVHNNPEVAALFRQMSEFSRRHAASDNDSSNDSCDADGSRRNGSHSARRPIPVRQDA